MNQPASAISNGTMTLQQAVSLNQDKVLRRGPYQLTAEAPVLVVLAAGKGTRFGQDPKCIQLVHGTPLARHSIEAFRRVSPSAVIGLVGHRLRALGQPHRRHGVRRV